MLPTTKIYNVDFKFIVDNALNKALWGKRWVVFQYDKVTVSMRLSSINIEDNKLYLQLSISSYDYNSDGSYNHRVTLPLDPAHQNFVAIKKSFVASIRALISSYEAFIIHGWLGYQRAVQYDDALQDEAENRANSILDDEGITNDDIREAFVEACRSKVYRGNAASFVNSYSYRVRPHYYLMIAAFFYPNDIKKYKEAEQLIGIDKVTPKYLELIEGIDDYIKAIHGDYEDEYLSEIELELESIY